MPSIEQEPLPRNALSSARLRTSPVSRLGHRDSGSRRLFTLASPCEPSRAGPPSTRPVATGDTLLWTSASLADFCNLKQRAGTPNERSILAREWSFRPATRRHQPMPVALARDTLPHRGPASLELHAPPCGRRVPLAWTGQLEGRSVRVKASRALLDDVARALLVAPRAPGSPARTVMRPGGPRHSSRRPRLLFDASPRRATPSKEPGCLLPHRNPYATGGWLLRARLDRGLVTPPPERHCSETRAPFATRSAAPSSDEESTRTGSTDRVQGSRSFSGTTGCSARHGFYDRISSRADVPRTSWALSLSNRCSAQHKKQRNNDFFHPLVAHRIVHSLSPSRGRFGCFSRASKASAECR
jgi:hypothetical protein